MTVCLVWRTVGCYIVKLHVLICALDWDESSTSHPGLSAVLGNSWRCTFIGGCIRPRQILNLVARERNRTQASSSHWAALWCCARMYIDVSPVVVPLTFQILLHPVWVFYCGAGLTTSAWCLRQPLFIRGHHTNTAVAQRGGSTSRISKCLKSHYGK